MGMLHKLDPRKPRGLRRLLGARGRCRELYGSGTHTLPWARCEKKLQDSHHRHQTPKARRKRAVRGYLTIHHLPDSHHHRAIVHEPSSPRPRTHPYQASHQSGSTSASSLGARGHCTLQKKMHLSCTRTHVRTAELAPAERRNHRIKSTCTTTKRIAGLSVCIAHATHLVEDKEREK